MLKRKENLRIDGKRKESEKESNVEAQSFFMS